MGLLDRITALFRQNTPAPATTTADVSAPRARSEPFDFAGQMQADTERRATVKTCREMYKKDPRARGVIKTLARDMTRGGFTVTVQNNPDAERIAQELNTRLNLDNTLDDWVRLTLRDGDTFLELGVDAGNDIALITRKPPLRMKRHSDDADRFADPARAYWLAPETWFGGDPPADALWFADWQIIHARWDHDAEERYGQPLFASATGAFKRIKEGETDIAVRRKTRAGVKYNHQFPEGTTPDQIEQYKELNQDNLNDPTAAISDYFGTAQISVIAGDGASLEAIGDVLHHVRTWWLASPVPMSLLGYGQDLNRDVLDKQGEQYQRALESLTQWVEGQFVKPLLERQWLLQGILPAGLEYEVKWKTTELLTVATVVAAADAVARLTAAGMPRVAAWELVERFLPGVDLEQAKAEMQAREDEMRAQMQQAQAAQPNAPAKSNALQPADEGLLDEFNPYHDRLGRFTFGGGAVAMGADKGAGAGGGKRGLAPATEALEYVQRLTSSSEATPPELSREAAAILKETVTESDYDLYRGMHIMKDRVPDIERRRALNKLKIDDEAPAFLAKSNYHVASATKKLSVAKYYASEGQLSIIMHAKVSRDHVVVDLEKLGAVLKRHGITVDADDLKYWRGDKEVLVREGFVWRILTTKGRVRESLEDDGANSLETPVTRQEAQMLGEVVAEYQKAAQMLERVLHETD